MTPFPAGLRATVDGDEPLAMKLFIALFAIASFWTLFCAARHIQVANRKPGKPGLAGWKRWQKEMFK